MNSLAHKPSLRRNILLATIGGLGLLALAQPAAASMYRWVDKGGHVHYGDTLPPSQSGRGYEIINPATGAVVQKVAPAKTPAQLAAEAAAKKAEEKRKAAETKQHNQDQVLLNLYNDVGDIKRARNTRLEDLDRQIAQLQGAISRAKRRAGDKSLPKSARADALKDAHHMQQSVEHLNDKRDKVVLKYDRIIKRFKQIKNTEASN